MIFFRYIGAAALSLVAYPAFATFCADWTAPKSLGALPKMPVKEASGMVVSKQFPGRVYWVNDSGDSEQFFYSQIDGSQITKVEAKGFKPRDSEAMALADCTEGPCLIAGDIGDNSGRRPNVKLTFFLEKQEYPGGAKILRELALKYPDSPRDAEAMAILPSGDLVIVSKVISLMGNPARVYTLSKAKLHDAKLKTATLQRMGNLPIATWFPEEGLAGQTVTDMAINVERDVMGLLTYINAIEIPLAKLTDLNNVSEWKKDRDYRLVPLRALHQQETMAYTSAPDRLVWSTEYESPDSPIYAVTCNSTVP